MFENETHLRITKVETSDGLNPLYDEFGNKVLSVIEAPYNKVTVKGFEEQNDKLPTHLKMKIEVIQHVPTRPGPAPVDPRDAEIAELRKQLADKEKGKKEAKLV